MSTTAEEAKRAEGGGFFNKNMKVGPPVATSTAIDIESGAGGGVAKAGDDDDSTDKDTMSVLTFLKIVSAKSNKRGRSRLEIRHGELAQMIMIPPAVLYGAFLPSTPHVARNRKYEMLSFLCSTPQVEPRAFPHPPPGGLL